MEVKVLEINHKTQVRIRKGNLVVKTKTKCRARKIQVCQKQEMEAWIWKSQELQKFLNHEETRNCCRVFLHEF